jgi:hypothetical protein
MEITDEIAIFFGVCCELLAPFAPCRIRIEALPKPRAKTLSEDNTEQVFGDNPVDGKSADGLGRGAIRFRVSTCLTDIALFGSLDNTHVARTAAEIDHERVVLGPLSYEGVPDAVPIVLEGSKWLRQEVYAGKPFSDQNTTEIISVVGKPPLGSLIVILQWERFGYEYAGQLGRATACHPHARTFHNLV